MLCERQIDVHFGDLIHDARQLRQNLHTDHAMLDRTLQKLTNVIDEITENLLVFVEIEPAVFGDLCEQCNQRLNDETL